MAYNTQKLTTNAELMQALADLAQDSDSHGLTVAVCMRGTTKELYLLHGERKSVEKACDWGYDPIGSSAISADVKSMYDLIAEGGSNYDESVQNGYAIDLTPEQWAILGLG